MSELTATKSEYGGYSLPSYDEIIATFGDIVKQWEVGSYQGDYIYLLKEGDRYTLSVVGYGSCSGCDALEGLEYDMKNMTEEEAQKEFNSFVTSFEPMQWYSSIGKLYESLTTPEANKWYFHEEEWEKILFEIEGMTKV